jgi:hypothetical protein
MDARGLLPICSAVGERSQGLIPVLPPFKSVFQIQPVPRTERWVDPILIHAILSSRHRRRSDGVGRLPAHAHRLALALLRRPHGRWPWNSTNIVTRTPKIPMLVRPHLLRLVFFIPTRHGRLFSVHTARQDTTLRRRRSDQGALYGHDGLRRD